MKVLIAIIACHKHISWMQAQRDTWIKDIPPGVDYRFFLGRPIVEGKSDEVYLDIPDDYKSLVYKSREMAKWALDQKYDFMYKTDTDTLVHPQNFLNSDFAQYDYVGGLHPDQTTKFASGGSGYCLSAKAMGFLAQEPIPDWLPGEDVFTSLTMTKNNILLHDDKRYKFQPGSVLDKHTIAFHLSSVYRWGGTYSPDQMLARYAEARMLSGENEDNFGAVLAGGPPPPEVKHAIILEYSKKFELDTFIETGTYLGDTVEASRGHFSNIYSIELSPELHNQAKERFVGDPTVHLLLGNSGDILRELLPTLTDNNKGPLFWLDAHYSGGCTVSLSSSIYTPVVQELDAIFSLCQHSVVLIDDARAFDGNYAYPTLTELKKYVAERAPGWAFEIEQDIIRLHEKRESL